MQPCKLALPPIMAATTASHLPRSPALSPWLSWSSQCSAPKPKASPLEEEPTPPAARPRSAPPRSGQPRYVKGLPHPCGSHLYRQEAAMSQTVAEGLVDTPEQ